MPPVSEAAVLESLRAIIDPDFGKNIVELGFVKNLNVEADHVAFAIELTTPACPVKEEFERRARECVMALEGVEKVSVSMTAQTRGSRGSVSDAEVLPEVKNVVAVASGKGGVGKSTVAINLALALREAGATVGVLDADVYGPSLPLLSGVQGRPRAEEKRIYPHESAGLKLMSMGFFLNDKVREDEGLDFEDKKYRYFLHVLSGSEGITEALVHLTRLGLGHRGSPPAVGANGPTVVVRKRSSATTVERACESNHQVLRQQPLDQSHSPTRCPVPTAGGDAAR